MDRCRSCGAVSPELKKSTERYFAPPTDIVEEEEWERRFELNYHDKEKLKVLFVQAIDGKFSPPTDTSEEWKEQLSSLYKQMPTRYDWVSFIEKELRTARIEGQMNAGFDAGKLAQLSFEEGAKQIEHCAEPECPECNHAAYKAGFEEGRLAGDLLGKQHDNYQAGHAAALSKVKEIAEGMKGQRGCDCQDCKWHTKGRNNALTDLLAKLSNLQWYEKTDIGRTFYQMAWQ